MRLSPSGELLDWSKNFPVSPRTIYTIHNEESQFMGLSTLDELHCGFDFDLLRLVTIIPSRQKEAARKMALDYFAVAEEIGIIDGEATREAQELVYILEPGYIATAEELRIKTREYERLRDEMLPRSPEQEARRLANLKKGTSSPNNQQTKKRIPATV